MTTDEIITFVLPDLVSHCPYPYRIHPNWKEPAQDSEQWTKEVINFTSERLAEFLGAKFGEFAATCYPETDASRLRTCMDFLTFAFVIDDAMDEFGAEGARALAECSLKAMRDPIDFQTDKKIGILTKWWFSRFAQGAHTSLIQRFVHSMKLTYQAMGQEAADRVKNHTPSLSSYVVRRRDASGVKPCLHFIEFAGGFCLPEDVLQSEVMRSLEESAVDYIAWVNDLFSYNKEAGAGHTYNLVTVVMKNNGCSLQDAIDCVGELCNSCIDRFERDCRRLPSWGPEIDDLVAKYIIGLQDWMSSVVQWSFRSERYFGKEGLEIQKSRIVQLHRGIIEESQGPDKEEEGPRL
ncbi:Isoprenoid synthase domain containing protein [Amanita muscaria]